MKTPNLLDTNMLDTKSLSSIMGKPADVSQLSAHLSHNS